MAKNDGGPAYPAAVKVGGVNVNTGEHRVVGVANHPGMSKREVFAKDAMKGMLGARQVFSELRYGQVAEYAVEYADALLAALEKE